MAIIEYCDNINCVFNKSYSCCAQTVDFDENACCITVRYDEEEIPPESSENRSPSTRGEKEEPSEPPDTDSISPEKQKSDWIKYI